MVASRLYVLKTTTTTKNTEISCLQCWIQSQILYIYVKAIVEFARQTNTETKSLQCPSMFYLPKEKSNVVECWVHKCWMNQIDEWWCVGWIKLKNDGVLDESNWRMMVCWMNQIEEWWCVGWIKLKNDGVLDESNWRIKNYWCVGWIKL